jgi:hypothetical protein
MTGNVVARANDDSSSGTNVEGKEVCRSSIVGNVPKWKDNFD